MAVFMSFCYFWKPDSTPGFLLPFSVTHKQQVLFAGYRSSLADPRQEQKRFLWRL
jgi:hypothetical protein